MRARQYLLATLKEIPKHCDTISHQLMLRSGLIRQVSSGLYTWLPTGLRVLQKIENIIREEMNKIGFLEILMPIVQPSKLWKQSGRWIKYGPELLRFKNRNNQEFTLGPTHEEIVSDLICKELQSYKQLPIQVYQIYTKYRDEARPRSGIIRAREFIMKDGYSFHTSQESLQKTYNKIYDIYHTIFQRIGVKFCVVQANPGKIGGILSHEFQAYSEIGEDKIAIPKFDDLKKEYGNIKTIKIQPNSPTEIMRLIEIPSHIHPKSNIIKKFNLSIYKTIKIITVRSINTHKKNQPNFLGLVIRTDHQLSYEKIAKIPEILFPLSIANDEEIQKIFGTKPNLFSFINLSIPLIIDYNVAIMNDFIAESDINGKYFFGINWNRDLPLPKIADLHKCKNNDNTQSIQRNIFSIQNSIEIGHIFQLGEKYSNKIHNCIQKHNKNNFTITMGCYGIGITRIIAIIVEQNSDIKGIIWPDLIAPFKIAIIPINMYRSIKVKNIAEKLYEKFISIIGTDVLIDDRQENPGLMFNDIDLLGIPHILIISDRNLNNQEIEYKYRKTGTVQNIKLNEVEQFLMKKLKNV